MIIGNAYLFTLRKRLCDDTGRENCPLTYNTLIKILILLHMLPRCLSVGKEKIKFDFSYVERMLKSKKAAFLSDFVLKRNFETCAKNIEASVFSIRHSV